MNNDNNMKINEKRVPEGWIMCPPFGDLINIGNTCFVPMKTPLGEKWNEFLFDKHQFTPGMIANEMRKRGKRLACIFSFANSNIRYDKSDLIVPYGEDKLEITQFWIRCNKDAPDEAKYRQFLDDFNSLKLGTNDIVGIHCTHGFNRTGFIIVRYLVEEAHMNLIDALTLFKEKRPPGIYKKDYIQKLFDIYGLENTWDTPVGTKASWTYPDPSKLPHYVQKEIIPPDTDDAPVVGTVITNSYQVTRLRSELMKMCRERPMSQNFPGSQPVTLAKSNERSLYDDPSYVATYKSDGTRYFMLCFAQKCYLVDRKLEFREVRVNMVNRRGENLERTLLDGELVCEDVKPPENKMNFLIFDIVMFEDIDLIDNNWDTRMDYVSKGCVAFRDMWREKQPERFENEEFRVSLKRQFPLNRLRQLEDYIKNDVLHKTDGVIFTPLSMPYIMGQCDRILKWKPIELNSADFIALEQNGVFYLAVRISYPRNMIAPNKPQFADIPVSILDAQKPEIFDGLKNAIVECSFDVVSKAWFPLRVRTDKTTPNAYSTFVKICVSIKDDITLKKLELEFK